MRWHPRPYQETGKHLTGQEVRDWLNIWGTDKETEASLFVTNTTK